MPTWRCCGGSPPWGRSRIFTQKGPGWHTHGPRARSGGRSGRPAVVPPAGKGSRVGRAPAGALGESRWGAFSESAEEGADREDSFPTGRWRPGWAAKVVVGAGLGGPGLQGGRSGCGGVQRAAWNASRLGVRIARRWRSLRFRSPPMALTRSRRESGTWPNRVSRTSRIASRAFWMRPS